MRLVFISNVLSPHQVPLCDAWKSMGIDLSFIETSNIDKKTLPIGWRFLANRDYLVNYTYFANHPDIIQSMILEADVVIAGGMHPYLIQERVALNRQTFVYSERIYKNLKEMAKWPYHRVKYPHIYDRDKQLYLLAASAFSAADYQSVGCFKNKTYKWGYFTHVETNSEINLSISDTNVTLMWCSRFINFKKPELPLHMAKRLKDKGYKFSLDMYGLGIKLEKIKSMALKMEINDMVHFMGEVSNKQVLEAMKEHEIFLFTSNKNEGWGAVANEAMSCGCVLVGSSAIGSIPFLVKDGENGCIFQSGNVESLTKRVEWLLQHPQKRKQIRNAAIKTMQELWAPKQVAERFLLLSQALLSGNDTPYLEGPCSKAEVLSNNWFKEYAYH